MIPHDHFMIKLKKLAHTPEVALKEAGWNWMLGSDTTPYVVDQLVEVNQNDANALYDASSKLYDMLCEAAQYAIDNNLFKEMGIDESLIPLIKMSWDDDRHVHLYSRFDLAFQQEDNGIKLIECNADTATCIPETAVIQWAQLKNNQLDEASQFNSLYESFVAQFEYIKNENSDLTPSILFSTMAGYPEDDTNVNILMEAAKEAGFDVDFAYVHQVEFSEEEGVFMHDAETASYLRFDYWFKLVPWEYIGEDENGLAKILTKLVESRKLIILNPAYTLLFQSKYILKVLWDLFPYHPLLLQTERYVIPHKKTVAKVLFGREGANLSIIEKGGQISTEMDGEYSSQPKIYQEFIDFPKDSDGYYYQAGVFYVGEPCALGFRRGGVILNNTAQFVGHTIE